VRDRVTILYVFAVSEHLCRAQFEDLI